MTDDLRREVQEILKGGTKSDRKGKPGNVKITGNSGTVVIGDGNRDIGRRESDRPEGEGDDTKYYGRRESDHAIRDELSQLRGQVKDLVQLINTQYLKDDSEDLKDDLPDDSDSLTSSDAEPSKRSDVSFCSRLYSHPSMRPRSRATSSPVSDCPTQSHFIPDVSYLMAAHNGKTRGNTGIAAFTVGAIKVRTAAPEAEGGELRIEGGVDAGAGVNKQGRRHLALQITAGMLWRCKKDQCLKATHCVSCLVLPIALPFV